MKRVQPQKSRSPVLKKLLANIGLEKVKRQIVSWAGCDWTFSPRPTFLTFWVNDRSGGGTDNNSFFAALIAAGVIAIDGDPLYKVFNIPLTATYELKVETGIEGIPPEEREVELQAYIKLCESCASQVDLDAECCAICGAILDPLEVPKELRLKYADTLFRFFMEKTAADPDSLSALVNLYRERVKDPFFDREELYPLLFLPKTKIPG